MTSRSAKRRSTARPLIYWPDGQSRSRVCRRHFRISCPSSFCTCILNGRSAHDQRPRPSPRRPFASRVSKRACSRIAGTGISRLLVPRLAAVSEQLRLEHARQIRTPDLDKGRPAPRASRPRLFGGNSTKCDAWKTQRDGFVGPEVQPRDAPTLALLHSQL